MQLRKDNQTKAAENLAGEEQLKKIKGVMNKKWKFL